MQNQPITSIETSTKQSKNPLTKPTRTDTATTEDSHLLTEREAAAYIRMSMSFLAKDRMNGYRHGHKQGPEFVKTGARNIRYRKSDLDDWIMKNRIMRTLPE